MNADAAPASSDDVLTDLVAFGMRAARVAVCLMEMEQAAAAIVAAALPKSVAAPACLNEATEAGLSLDQFAQVMAGAVPRVAMLTRALERSSRLVRRCVALTKRIEAGWPRGARVDDRAAMVRRQVKRGVSEVIRRVSDSDDTAERLFDDLYERLDDPGFEQALLDWPVAEIVRQVCRDLGLATGDGRVGRGASDSAPLAGRPHRPPSG